MISPTNFHCAEACELLDDFRRNNIEPHLRVLLTEHLEQCPDCAAELRSREDMARILRETLPAGNLPPFTRLSPEVQRAIETRVRTSASPERKNAQLLSFMLACAVLAVVSIALVQIKIDQQITPAPTVAAVQENARASKPAAPRQESITTPVARKASSEISPTQPPAQRSLTPPPPVAADQVRQSAVESAPPAAKLPPAAEASSRDQEQPPGAPATGTYFAPEDARDKSPAQPALAAYTTGTMQAKTRSAARQSTTTPARASALDNNTTGSTPAISETTPSVHHQADGTTTTP